jgi:hypothetical protein
MNLAWTKARQGLWHTFKLFNRLNCKSKGEDIGRRSWVCSLAHNTLGVEGRARASRWD